MLQSIQIRERVFSEWNPNRGSQTEQDRGSAGEADCHRRWVTTDHVDPNRPQTAAIYIIVFHSKPVITTYLILYVDRNWI